MLLGREYIIILLLFYYLFLVGDKHQFKNSPFVYMFRYDDDTFQASDDTLDILAKVNKYLYVYAYCTKMHTECDR